ncbi:hypothetical protein [Pseudoduganella danionis]|jgi:hypothetical protein|uniref:hypothetical protein n=1 Tax=Pseudoduganella danionis TaxID=1890295 RepID=UPI0035AEEADD
MMTSGRWATCAFALGMLQAFLQPSVCAADDGEFYRDRDGTLIGKATTAAPAFPVHLAGTWATAESLFAGTEIDVARSRTADGAVASEPISRKCLEN